MTRLIVDRFGQAFVEGDPGIAPDELSVQVARTNPVRARGYETGAAVAPNDDLLTNVIGVTLDCLLDETQSARDRERSYENLLGFIDGYYDMMAIKPLLFLTRQQTAKVGRLPRRIQRAWLAEYRRGVQAWQRRGGTLKEGNRPYLPEIPG